MALTNISKATRQQLADELARIQVEHEDFRRAVAQIALETKESEGWCSDGFRDAMDNLGLLDLLPSNKRLVTLQVVVDAEEQNYDPEYMSDESWADAAISAIRYTSAANLHGYEVEDAPQDK